MRETRTYGLNEGLLARAFRTAGWGLLHHGRVVKRRPVVEMAPPVTRNSVVNGRAERPRPASPARVLAFPSTQFRRRLRFTESAADRGAGASREAFKPRIRSAVYALTDRHCG